MSAWNHVRFTGMCSLDKGCQLVFGLCKHGIHLSSKKSGKLQ